METLYRDDDIFLTESPTQGRQLYDFNKFKTVHEYIASKGHKHAIAIIASEIENYPELTNYIKNKKDEFIFGVHGWAHNHCATWKSDVIEISLSRAKHKIEETFETQVEWFFPTWNELSPELIAGANRADLRINNSQTSTTGWLKGERADAICFHYWSDGQFEELKRII